MNNPILGMSVSHGTLRDVDLIDVFTNALSLLDCQNDTDKHAKLIREACEHKAKLENFNRCLDNLKGCALIHTTMAMRDTFARTPDILESLQSALEAYAPAGYYFGSLEGDASDFGFWPESEADLEG